MNGIVAGLIHLIIKIQTLHLVEGTSDAGKLSLTVFQNATVVIAQHAQWLTDQGGVKDLLAGTIKAVGITEGNH